MRAYKGLGYDAVAVSAIDLTAGNDFFQISLDDKFPWISANIFDKNKKRIFPAHRVKNVGSLSVGIIGLTGGSQLHYEDLIIGDWRTALQTEIEQLEQNCDILMALSNLSESENKQLATDFPQIDLVVTNYQKGGNSPPQITGNCLFSQVADRGRYLGRLDIDWQPQGRGHIDSSQQSGQLKNFKSKFLPIVTSSSVTTIETIAQDIKKSINTYNRHRLNALKSESPVSSEILQTDEIADFSNCRQCHEKQTLFWQNTAHADAFRTLSMRGQSFNLECLPCHVTGGNIGPSSTDAEKLLLLSLGDDRKTVSCEVCHGPGRNHLLSPEDVVPVRTPPKTTCLQCHTPDHDDHFDYREKLSMIACPAN